MIDYPSMYSSTVNGTKSYNGTILIDINGRTGPNIAGRDLFHAKFYDDGSIDVNNATPECKKTGVCNGTSLTDIREELFNSQCKSSQYGEGCFGKILNDNWEMTY